MSDITARRSDVAEKWGDAVAARGFAQIPNYLMQINHFLDSEHQLSPTELLVLLQVVGTWWRTGDKPFPSMKTLAARCGVSERQVQRAVNALEKRKLLERVKRRHQRGIIASNAYSLAPLVEILGEIAKIFPNDFPRRVTVDQAQAISALLGPRTPDAAGEVEKSEQPPSPDDTGAG